MLEPLNMGSYLNESDCKLDTQHVLSLDVTGCFNNFPRGVHVTLSSNHHHSRPTRRNDRAWTATYRQKHKTKNNVKFFGQCQVKPRLFTSFASTIIKICFKKYVE